MKTYSCDFETTTEPFYNKYGFTRVWVWGAVNLDNDEFLINYLVGMDVYDEDGSCVGVVSAVGENLANDLLSVKDANGKEHLVPFVKELVPIVNLKENKIVINNIEGLIS